MGTTAIAPVPQHMKALKQANRVRLARAELKRQVAEGEASVADIVLKCPWEAESMEIGDLLMCQHRWGRSRCRRFLTPIPMAETKTIGSMTERQREELASRLNGDSAANDSVMSAGIIDQHLEEMREREEVAAAAAARAAEAAARAARDQAQTERAQTATRQAPSRPAPPKLTPDLIGEYRAKQQARRSRRTRPEEEFTEHSGVPIGPARINRDRRALANA
jgi:hypothetical protein